MKKKNLMLYLFFILVVILIPSRVDGVELCDSEYKYACSSCVYKGHSTGVTFYLYAREDASGKINVSYDYSKPNAMWNYKISDFNVSANNFTASNDKLTCPQNLHVKTNSSLVSGTSASGKNTYMFELSFAQKYNPGETLVYDKEASALNFKTLKSASSNNKPNGSTSLNEQKSKVCHFSAKLLDSNFKETGKTIYVEFSVDGKLPSSVSSGGTTYSVDWNGLTVSDFGDSCNAKYYVLCNQGSNSTAGGPNSGATIVRPACTVSREKIPFSEEVEVQDVPDGSDLGGDDVLEEQENSKGQLDFGDKLNDEDCQAVLGSTLEIINTVFNWIKIIAPILLIVFGSLDFGSAVLQDNQDALKKATSKFIKRAIAAVAIFFLPFIINLLLSLPGVNSGLENALCGISKVVIK